MWTSKADIRREIYRRYRFEECIVRDLRWLQEGATLQLDILYIWADDDGWFLTEAATAAVKTGTLRPESQERRLVTFAGVQEVALRNSLASELLRQPELADWGISEIAVLELENHDLFLGRYPTEPELHHVSILFGGLRRLDLVFHALDVSTALQP